MLFYDAVNPAPNPRRVRIYLAEKGLTVPSEKVSIPKGEHKGEAYRAALNPEPPLFGVGAQGQAEVDMWTRRVELRLMTPIAMVWVHTHPLTARVIPKQYTDFGESNRPRIDTVMREFDTALTERQFLDGKGYSMADIVLQTTIDFAKFIGVDMPKDAMALRAWYDRVAARPSAAA